MKKILLLNRGSSDNLGDQAISFTLQSMLKSLGYEVDFRDLTEKNTKKRDYYYEAQEKYKSGTSNNKSRNKVILRFFWFVKSISIFHILFKKKYDALLIGGGQLINSNASFPIAIFLWVILFKRISKGKIIFFGVGSVNNLTKFDSYLYKKALSNVDLIYLRDLESMDFVYKEFDRESFYTPDVAFLINNFTSNAFLKEKNTVLIGLTDYSRYIKYNKDKNEDEFLFFWEKLIYSYLNKGYKISLFYTTINDLVEAFKIQEHFKLKFKLNLSIVDVHNLNDFISVISTSQIVVSPRMHALIIGFVYGCEVVPIVISDKIKSFKNQYLDKTVSLEQLQSQIKELLQSAID